MLYRSERMANTWESYFGMGKCGHISANRVGESFRRAMKEGLGDMDQLNSEAEDEEEADSAVWITTRRRTILAGARRTAAR